MVSNYSQSSGTSSAHILKHSVKILMDIIIRINLSSNRRLNYTKQQSIFTLSITLDTNVPAKKKQTKLSYIRDLFDRDQI